MNFIDSHAHIYLENFSHDLPEVIRESLKNSVNQIYMPNIDDESIADMLAVEEEFGDVCRSMIGLHPVSVKSDYKERLKTIYSWLGKRPFAAIGEIGQDLYWDKSYYKEQIEAFKIQVDWAEEYKLPIVIHCRESMRETIDLVRSLKTESLRGVFHCFTGTLGEAEEIIDLGFYLGIGGVVTFKNGGLDSILPDIGLDHLLLETDSPYLTPAPFRGKRNDPSKIPLIAQKIAEIKNCTIEEVAAVTTANTNKLFKK